MDINENKDIMKEVAMQADAAAEEEVQFKSIWGSAEFYYELKEAYDAGDKESVDALIYPHVVAGYESCVRKYWGVLLNCDRKTFREDAILEMYIEVYKALKGFFGNPENDPQTGSFTAAHRAAFFKKVMACKMIKIVNAATKHTAVDSLDKTIDSDGDDKRTQVEMLCSNETNPEETVLLRERIREALRVFYSLNSEPDTLTAVGYSMVYYRLIDKRVTYQHFSDYFARNKVRHVLLQTAEILRRKRIDTSADASLTKPLRCRLAQSPGIIYFRELTPQRLMNRTSALMKKVRDIINADES